MSHSLFSEVTRWLTETRAIESAVLFGSQANSRDEALRRTAWDIDLHVISSCPRELERVDWSRAFPDSGFQFHAARPATGGVRKVTVVFAAGQIDLVIVPRLYATAGNIILRTKLYRRLPAAIIALNEMATCLHTGFRFLKGEAKWGRFYANVARQMPGVRLEDSEACRLADAFVADFVWVRQKIDSGELIAAQHVLHRQMSETNLRLFRELQFRRNRPPNSFGLGRRVETYATAAERGFLGVNATLEGAQLIVAANKSYVGLKALMAEIVPVWGPPANIQKTTDAAD
jgi:hypothetical protein